MIDPELELPGDNEAKCKRVSSFLGKKLSQPAEIKRNDSSKGTSQQYRPVSTIERDDELCPFELNGDSDEEELDTIILQRTKASIIRRFFPCLRTTATDDHGQHQRRPKEPRNSQFGTIFLLLNTMIGSGILNQPQVFLKSGLVGGAGLYLICVSTVWFAQQKLLQAGLATGVMDYGRLARATWGLPGALALDGALWLGGFFAQCSYLTVIAGEGAAVLRAWGGGVGGPGGGGGGGGGGGSGGGPPAGGPGGEELWVLPAVTLLAVLPLCLNRHFGHLAAVSVLSIASMALVIGCVLVAGPAEGREVHLASGRPLDPLRLFDPAGAAAKVGAMLYGVNSQSATFFAFNAMAVRTPEQWRKVTSITMAIGASMCLLCGISGYSSFRGATEGDILDNFVGHAAFTVVKFCVIVHLCFYLPVSFMISRHSFAAMFLKLDVLEMGSISFILLTVVLLGMPFAVVMALFFFQVSEGEAFGYILDVTGALCTGLISLTLPGLIVLKVFWRDHRRVSAAAAYLFLFGLALNVLVPLFKVYERLEARDGGGGGNTGVQQEARG